MSSNNFKNIALKKPSLDYFEVSGEYVLPKNISKMAIVVLAKKSSNAPEVQGLAAFNDRRSGETVSFYVRTSRYINEYSDFEFRVLTGVDPLHMKNLNEYEIIETNTVPITASLMR